MYWLEGGEPPGGRGRLRADLEAEGLGLGLTWPRPDIVKVLELDTDEKNNPDALRAFPFLDVLFEGRVQGPRGGGR